MGSVCCISSVSNRAFQFPVNLASFTRNKLSKKYQHGLLESALFKQMQKYALYFNQTKNSCDVQWSNDCKEEIEYSGVSNEKAENPVMEIHVKKVQQSHSEHLNSHN